MSRRISFTEDEIRYMIDIIDAWVENYQSIDLELAEIAVLHEDMSVAIDVRNKLWRQLNG